MKPVVNEHIWSEETLFRKAKLYAEQMELHTADDWQFGFWSALSLELLSRSALARISPVLLADNRNWRNLSYALDENQTKVQSVPRSLSEKEVLDRLMELIPAFNSEIRGFCNQHMERRNLELHSGSMAFEGIGTSEWLPEFYSACDILLKSMNRNLEDFISDHETARSVISEFKNSVADTVKNDIEAHRKVWSNKSLVEQENASKQAEAWATRHAGHRVPCPACKSQALLKGTPSGSVSTEVKGDVVIQRQTMLPSSFECISCGLRISGLSKLSASGLGNAFSAKYLYTAADYFQLYTEEELEDARNEMPEYEPDFNE